MDNTTTVLPSTFNLSTVSNVTSSSTMAIDRLLPALLECFGIILCGYIAGRAHIITPTQSKGLGNFVSKFALPALLFKNMVLLDFGDVIWPFLWSILIAKVSIFCVVCVLTLLVANRDSRFSKAGLFSIFATQSNDFALGYPIVEALYRNTHPEYLQYIYLVAPVSLILLNPLGFALCEVQRWQSGNSERPQSKLQVLGTVAMQVLRNPIVFMVVVGLAAHFLLGQRIPPFMAQFVDGLANSFGGAALFYLGLTMVGQMRRLTRSTVVALILLITAKLLVMPLLCRDLVELLDWDNSSALNHSSLSNYAFLYGVFPTAPSVAIYAAHYGMELEVVTSGMVISTFLSAPIMYVAAWLLTIPSMEPSLSVQALQTVSFDISIISSIALMWTIAVMFLSKKYKRLPHLFTVNMLLAQFLSCVGMMIWNFTVEQGSFLWDTLSFTLLYGSLYSTYVWPGLIALSLVLQRRNGQLTISPGFLVIAGWGVPCLVMGILLITGRWSPDTIDSAFFYGTAQIITTGAVLFCSIVLCGGSLICLSRDYRTLRQSSSSSPNGPEDTQPLSEPEDQTPPEEPSRPAEDGNRGCQTCDRAPPQQPMPDMIVSTNMIDSLQGVCDSRCESTRCMLAQEEERRRDSDTQLGRHTLLCLLLLVSLLANLSSCIWWLFHREPGRLYLELQFFCVILNYGQGFISFGLFGLDKHLIILPFKQRIARLWGGRGGSADPSPGLPEEIRLTCTQFMRYHQEQCIQDIVQRKRCGEHSVASTFLGSDLVEWLMRVGLARDRGEALLYGSRLHEGGVLQHITHNYCFQDEELHYHFTEPTTTTTTTTTTTPQQEAEAHPGDSRPTTTYIDDGA
ncbi:lysosomal cholesterol signaling protein [Engraulis encrasicolus]|uniref:lysosomal cholesterol signaling protein n=1 Tax=Engraulis encrasicolus TaxID=184585 RepID=UPI002FD5E55E